MTSKNIIKIIMILAIAIFFSACTSNNASKLEESELFKDNKNMQKPKNKLPAPELHVLFQINKNEIELIDILPTHIQKKKLLSLLAQNEGKNFSEGDTLVDCIILTNTSKSKSCFSRIDKNIPINSVFHESKVSGSMIFMTALVPFLVVGAAADGDFYVDNKINSDLLNKIGSALKRKIFNVTDQIHQSLITYKFDELPQNIKPYGQLIDHKVLISSINNSQILSQLSLVEKVFNNIDYDGFIVKPTQINQRAKPTTKSKIQSTHKRGELILAESSKDGWIYNGEGWIYKNILLSLNDDVRTKLLHKKNNLTLDSNYKYLISGNSIAEIDKVLKSNAGLAGVSQKKIKSLKVRKYQLSDENDYNKAAAKNTLKAYKFYLDKHKNGSYRNKVMLAKKKLYMKQDSFNGYMEAYKLTGDTYLLTLAEKSVLKTTDVIVVSPSLVDIYFKQRVVEKNSIPKFIDLTKKMHGINSVDYVPRMLKLNGISKKFTPEDYLQSLEYKYILSGLIPTVSVSYKHEYIDMLLKYSDIRIVIREDAQCVYKATKTGVRSRGFLESVFTLNANDKESYTYDIYSCKLAENKLAKVQAMLKGVKPYRSADNLAKLARNWNSEKVTDRYTYSSGSSSSTNSANSNGTWRYTVECTGTTFSGTPKRTYSGSVSNSDYDEAYKIANREQSNMSCAKRFGNEYVGEGYLKLELQ